MKRYNLIYLYVSYLNGLLNYKSETSSQGKEGLE